MNMPRKRTLVDAAQDPLASKHDSAPKREKPKNGGTSVWMILGAMVGGVIIGLVSSRFLRLGL
jgi:hypothetical protein